MKHVKRLITGVLLLLLMPVLSVSAVEGDSHLSDIVRALLNNMYLQENIRLIGLAEESYDTAHYDEAVEYALQAIKFSEMSDEYVTLQMRIKWANDAIDAAQIRLDWARGIHAPNRYPVVFNKAELTFTEALDFRTGEDWDAARNSALMVIAILSEIPDTPPLPSQYLVRNWHVTRDCLWNIAAKPQIYGDPLKWPVLYRANRQKLRRPDNPDLIHPGTLLDIPSIDGEYRAGVMED